MAVAISTIRENIYSELYTLLSAITDPQSRGTQWWFASFPDERITDKNDYPIGIIGSAMVEKEILSLRIIRVPVSVTIEIYSTGAKQLDQLADDVSDALESNDSTLRAAGLFLQTILPGTRDMFERGGIKVHVYTLTVQFEFSFDRS